MNVPTETLIPSRGHLLGRAKNLGGAGVGAGFTQTAKALDQHGRGHKGILAVDQVVEELVVGRWAHIEELFNSALFSSGIAPPLALKVQDPYL